MIIRKQGLILILAYSVKRENDLERSLEGVSLVEAMFGVYQEYKNESKIFKQKFHLSAVKFEREYLAAAASMSLRDSTKVIHDHLESANGISEERNIFKNLEGYKNLFHYMDSCLQPNGIFNSIFDKKRLSEHTSSLDKVRKFLI